MVVRYEDLLTDVVLEVKRMLHFLKFPYNDTELVVNLADRFTQFQRKPPAHSNHDFFNPLQMRNINNMIAETVQELKQNHFQSFRIEEYLFRNTTIFL